MIHRTPIRWLLPGLVLLFGLLGNGIIIMLADDSTRTMVINNRIDAARVRLVQFQMDLEDAGADELRLIQRRIIALSQDPNVVRATLTGPDDRVITSTRMGDVNSILDTATLTNGNPDIGQLKDQVAPQIWRTDQQLWGGIRVCRLTSSREQGCGMLLIEEDLGPQLRLLNEARATQLSNALVVTLMLSLMVVVVLYNLLVRRMGIIADTASAFSQGETDARITTAGNDELDRIGKGINAMLDQVSESRQATEERNERLRALFDENTEGLIVIDRHSTITEFNHRAEEIFGYRKAEIVGQSLTALMPEKHMAMHQQTMDHYMETGEGKVIGKSALATEAKRRDGSIIPVKIAVSEVRGAGEITFIGSVTDLSEIRMLEQQAQRAQKMDAVGSLTGGIAHDFNNLLGIIIGNLDMARRHPDDPEALQRRLDKASAAAMRGSELTRRLLAFTRQRPERVKPVDVTEMLDGMRELMASSLTSKIRLTVEHPGALPPVVVDPGSLEDAIVNLLINARDAMQDGGEVKLLARETEIEGPLEGQLTEGEILGPALEILVIDEGDGVPAAVMNRIFEPFFSTKPKNQGTGLGLAMVYAFVKRASGGLTIDSEPGVGTRVRLLLPIANSRDLQLAEADLQPSELPRAKHGERILVVEDEEAMQELATTSLTELGYQVVAVGTGQAALDVLEQDQRFHLVLTDVVMPGGIDGLALARHIEAHLPGMRILLASGYMGDSGQRQFDRWATLVLDKPYSLAALARRVRQSLDAPIPEHKIL